MEDNPYSALAGAFGGSGSAGGPRLRIGTVTSISPLTISIGGLPVGITELRWNAQLLAHKQTARVSEPNGSLNVYAVCPYSSHSSATINGGTLTETQDITPDPIRTGDQYLTYSEDDQTFVVLCKVV
jgi:hypothetical protein